MTGVEIYRMTWAMASTHEPESVAVAHDDHSEELTRDEPETPGWLPLLGGTLFLGAAIFFVATVPPGKTSEELQHAAAAAAAEAQAKLHPPAPPEAPPQQPGAAPGGQQPAQGG